MTLFPLKKTKEERKKKKTLENHIAKDMSVSQSPVKQSSASSQLTMTTHDTSLTDTLKAYEEIIDNQDTALAQKDSEIIQLRQEVFKCQQQLSKLQNMVKQLEVNVELSSHRRSPETKKTPLRSEEKDDDDSVSISDYDEEEEVSWSDEFVSEHRQSLKPSSAHSLCSSSRKNTSRSRRSIRRDSYQSLSNSIHSRSRRSIKPGSIRLRSSSRLGDGASVTSQTSLQTSLHSVSLSVKSLPREIQLTDGGDDNDSSCNESCNGKKEKDSRSVGSGSRSRRSRSSPSISSTTRKSMPAGTRRRRNSRAVAAANDVLMVENERIVDPCGEKGVYSGALSKSTGMPNGKGLFEYEGDERWYEGDWSHGRWNGQGRLSNGNGDVYEGGLANDRKHGTGLMKFTDGRIFEGKYIWGRMIDGTMTYQDGSVYQGPWQDGLRHGTGTCTFADGSWYEGEFRDGNFEGQGKLTWNDGGWYSGEWKDGEMHGNGKEIRRDGALRHDGKWYKGQPVRS